MYTLLPSALQRRLAMTRSEYDSTRDLNTPAAAKTRCAYIVQRTSCNKRHVVTTTTQHHTLSAQLKGIYVGLWRLTEAF